MIALISAADVAVLIGAVVALLGLLGGGVAWLVKMGREQKDAAVQQGRMLEQIEQLTRATSAQMKNNGGSTLKDAVDRNEQLLVGIVAALERLERTVTEDRAARVRADAEVRSELDRVVQSADREHRSLWQRIGDGLGVSRPGEIEVPDEPY